MRTWCHEHGQRIRVFALFVFLPALLCLSLPSAGQAQTAPPRSVAAVAYNAAGDLFLADALGNRIYEATVAGDLTVVAGTGVQGFSGDGGPALAAQLSAPQGLVVGGDGTLFIADTGNQRIRALSPSGVLTTVAGTGVAGFSGDGAAASQAHLRQPTALAVESSGALLLCDTGNHRIRRIRAGTITSVAGTGVQGVRGDGGPATLAELDSPMGVATAADGRIFLADTRNHRIRAIGVNGTIITVAGTGTAGFSGDGAQAVAAQLSGPRGLALTTGGVLLIADAGNQRVRQVDAAGIISTVAGSGREGLSLDGDAASAVALRQPRSVAVSPFGYLVLADALNATARAVVPGGALFRPAALAAGRNTGLSVQAKTEQTYGQGTWLVSLAGAVGVPEGRVEAVENATTVAAAAIADGSATLDLSALSAASHSLLVQYPGDGLNPAVSGSAAQLTVDPVAVTVRADAAFMPYGAPFPALTGSLEGVLPGDLGQVQPVLSANIPADADVGTYPIAATLTGSKAANYRVTMALGSGQLQIMRAASAARLGADANVFAGLPTTLRATVSPAVGGHPTGQVQFLDGSQVIATAAVVTGAATALYVSPPAGGRSLSVQYLGDKNFLPSVSTPVQVSFAALPDFTVAPSGVQTASTTSGTTATYSFLVSAQPGPFTGAISLSAAGLPAGAQASFAPPQVVPGSGSAVVTMTVQMPATTAHKATGIGARGTVVACLGFSLFLFRRRQMCLCLCALLGSTLLLAGCGARTLGEGLNSVGSQTYTLHVTGTATNLAGVVVVHETTVTLTVTP